MLKRVLLVAALVVTVGASTQVASADPTHAKNATFVTAICGGQEVHAVVSGNGTFTPAHVIGNTSVFIPIAFNLTFTFTMPDGQTFTDTNTASKPNASQANVTCDVPEALNTSTSPEGTFSLSGTVTGFFTPR